VQDVLPPPAGALLHDAVVRVHQSRVPFTTEYSLTINSAEQIYEARFWPFADAEVMAMVRNITERQRVEDALRHREEQYRFLFDDNPSMYFTVDVNGVILSVNRFGAEQLGYQVGELLGQSVLEVFYGEDRLTVQQHLAACLQQPRQIFHWELRKVRKDGSVIWVKEAARSAQDVDGKTIVLIVCEDITETRQLRQKAERMERLAALGQLSTTIAHEIRNPLGSIRLNFQFLASQSGLAGKLNKNFLNIESGIARIQKIIAGILDFSRPIPPALKMTDLHKVLDSALHSTRHEFDEAGITVQKDYQALRPYVMLDAGLMVQVFVNLFLNAKDAMSAQGKLLIRTAALEKNIAVHIEDNGMGILPENLEKIYNPFFTTKTDGIGLGLAVVFRILEQHQAQINVESAVGRGTRFTITLPFNQPSVPP
jgi:PAS domain S-box-containing protein